MSTVRHQTNDTLEIPNIDVLRMLAAQSFSILFQKNCALVVLEHNIVLNLVSLGFHEVLSPTDRRHEVIDTYDPIPYSFEY
jgi:hypothetical protein